MSFNLKFVLVELVMDEHLVLHVWATVCKVAVLPLQLVPTPSQPHCGPHIQHRDIVRIAVVVKIPQTQHPRKRNFQTLKPFKYRGRLYNFPLLQL